MKQILYLLVFTGLMAGCDATRNLAGKEQLYTGARLVVENEELNSSHKKELEGFVKQFHGACLLPD